MGKLDKKLQEERFGRKLKKALKDLIFFPRIVSKKYARYNIGLREMASSFSEKGAEIVWAQNVKRVNLFIRIPLAIGFMSGILLWYVNWSELAHQLKISKLPVEISLVKNRKTPSKWIQYRPDKVKISYWYFVPFVFGYATSLAGSFLLSLNRAFTEEKTIQQACLSQRYLFEDGTPWDVVWTPYGILFYAYNCDPNAVQKNVRFWNSINFKPDDPKISPRDANVFYIRKAYDLPDSIILNIAPLIKAKQASMKQESKAAEEHSQEIEVQVMPAPEEATVDVEQSGPEQDTSDEGVIDIEDDNKILSEDLPFTKKDLVHIQRANLKLRAKSKKKAVATPKPPPKKIPELTKEDVARLRRLGIFHGRKSGF